MSRFQNKLKNIILENAAPTFNNLKVYPNDVTESDIVNEITGSAPLYGLKFLGYEEGVASFSTYSKASVLKFTQYLDEHDYVETYDISVAVTEPFTLKTELTTELDFDTTRESEFIEFFIDVAIDFNLVTYNDVYVGGPEIDTNQPFLYPKDEVEVEQDAYIHSDNAIGFDSVYPQETPLLVRLSNEKSFSPFGRFMVTVHPKNPDQILVQCNYTSVPSIEDANRDIETINSGDFGSVFEYEFKLVKPAAYVEGETSTTSAVYKTTKTKNAINIVESAFDEVDEYNMLSEITRVIKVNSRGKRRIKMQCKPGFKYDVNRKACVKISGAEMAHSRIAHRQMARTKKSFGEGYKTRIVRKVRRAKRFRKMMGL